MTLCPPLVLKNTSTRRVYALDKSMH